ncbi:MAG: N-acyl-L-amino acid amidohydrolase [Bacteroidetes bacterium 24-39-8]|nr:MAG: N-acyl-L-amino acid amidohydrolase [Sphingobacteriia bacterium 35-40-8]OYZ47849.1 MAG: N-acyl-L-amino acid amidohydrolase [Bacteroidetes bacterium 24-39-8]OZA67911.1 MAG: N-acyl-L-amino acid amidohydrolase [Sphingobacteriia bacterium 39-39-8]HQR92335.1 amidohydrolase [Sediminibacterium sp.]HQS56356.1 amidohydrolase [Sediminibacterium sp.]
MRKQFFLGLLALPYFAGAQMTPAKIEQSAKEVNDSVIAWRRHLHQYPELSNRESNTMKYIVEKLQGLGLEIKSGVAKTGVVAILKGGKPGPVVALRADIDGLPVIERANLPYKSIQTSEYGGQKVGIMHACGHDTHTAILLGTANAMSKIRKDIPGTVVFIFQPAEEGAPDNEEGGAPLMMKEGVMTNPKVDAIFGIHINSQTEIGTIKYKSGSIMASSDWFTIKVKGKQSHGSQPWSGIDPIVVATQIITGLQTIVSRQSELTKAPVVITVGRINSGVRANIIPEELNMEGTIRTLDGNMQKDVHERIRITAQKIAEASGATAEVMIDTKTLVTYNDPALVKMMLPSLEAATGKGNLLEQDWTTGAEDFSFYGQKAPAFFFFLGGMPKGMDPKKAAPHHTPDFYIDDSRLDVGVKAYLNLVMDYAQLKAK